MSKRWREIQRERDSFERGVINDVRKAMNIQARQLKKAIGGMGYRLEDLDSVVKAIKDDPFIGAYKKTYGRVGGYFAKKTNSEIKAAYPHLMHKARTEDEWIRMVRESLSAAAAERVISVSQTSRERAKKMLQDILSEGFEQGLSIDKIAAKIDGKIDKAWKIEKKFRAVRIARTEIVAASNRGQLSGADATGLPMKKQWIASGSGEPRSEHLAMNSVDPIDKDERFLVMGEGLLYPGDPSGSPANVINCRCTMGFAVI